MPMFLQTDGGGTHSELLLTFPIFIKKYLTPPFLYKIIKTISARVYWKEIVAALMILLAFVFFRSERKELFLIIPNIENADARWLIAGVGVTFIYVLLQSGMYVSSFSSIGLLLKWIDAIELFLKRNILSIFLPAGGVSSLAYTPSQLRRRGFNKTQINQASGLYAFAGLFTVFLVGFPVIMFAISANNRFQITWISLVLVVIILTGILWMVRSIKTKGKMYRLIEDKFPRFIPEIDKLFATYPNTKKYTGTILFSTGVEFTGMFHLLIAMLALGLPASFSVAAVAYVVSVLLMITSPFLRGLGAIEISLVFILESYGYTTIESLSVTVLYRVFEFWLPMVLGLLAFAWRGWKIFVRIAPAVLIFTLGLINIISIVTPPIHFRLKLVREFLPLEAINASNVLILFVGVALLITSAYMFKGLKNAWRLALLLAVLSFIGNLTKALDYEEATFAAGIIILLLLSRDQYKIRSSIKWIRIGFLFVVVIFLSVLLLGFIGFYFMDVKHFGIDFSWKQALFNTIQIFTLGVGNNLHPRSVFAHEFISVINILGFLSWGFLVFTLIKPFFKIETTTERARERANLLLARYGRSSVDYFKTYCDKLFFFSEMYDAFISYRIANGFAIVLEEPVCAEENKLKVLKEFYKQSSRMGLSAVFYRVGEESIIWFDQLKKQKMIIGQEAILEVDSFSLEGKDKRSLRNALNSLQKKGYITTIHKAPLENDLVKKLEKISDEWLIVFDKEEQVFSQGLFNVNEIMQQDVITVEDEEGQISAFLNIIPDYSPDECTYDLIRKTADAPGGCIDALIIKMIEYAKENKKESLNLGLVPMTGITNPESPAEQLVKYLGKRLKRFKHYQGLRDFKEKYASSWENKFLVYENDYDLLQLPAALNKVMQPLNI